MHQLFTNSLEIHMSRKADNAREVWRLWVESSGSQEVAAFRVAQWALEHDLWHLNTGGP